MSKNHQRPSVEHRRNIIRARLSSPLTDAEESAACASSVLPLRCVQEEFGHLKVNGEGVTTGSAAEYDDRGGAGVI